MILHHATAEDLRAATDRVRDVRLAAGGLHAAGQPSLRRDLARWVRRSH